MATKTLISCGALLLQLQSVLAVPVTNTIPAPLFRRGNITIEPSHNITPIVTEIEEITGADLQGLIDQVENGIDKLFSRTEALAPRETGTEGALLTFIDGDFMPGADPACEDFVINGPFTTIHAFMGTGNVRGISATSFGGNTTEIYSGETIVDPGEFTFTENERITKFSIARIRASKSVSGFTFETDAGNTYSALGGIIEDGSNTPTYEELNVGSGILARIRGTNCQSNLGIFGSFGVDFLDELDSISISNIDYDGFTNNIMPTGAGTQLSIGSQILDNRNSSEKQTITLTTTDAITQQRTITTEIRAHVGGSVAVEGSVGIPFVSSGKVTTEANWQLEKSSVRLFFPFFSPLHMAKMENILLTPRLVRCRHVQLRNHSRRHVCACLPSWQILHSKSILHTVQDRRQDECNFHGHSQVR